MIKSFKLFTESSSLDGVGFPSCVLCVLETKQGWKSVVAYEFDEGKTKIGHVGIYMGNDEFIHAANSKRGVVTDNLSTNSYYNTRFVTARRIVE